MRKKHTKSEQTETQRCCTECFEWFDKTAKDTMKICKACNTARVKAQDQTMRMWRRAKVRATANGMGFDIEPSDIVFPEYCPALGIKLKHMKGKSGAFSDSPSIDRIDNDKGYIKGNIQVISAKANQMKNNASFEQLVHFAYWILDTVDPVLKARVDRRGRMPDQLRRQLDIQRVEGMADEFI